MTVNYLQRFAMLLTDTSVIQVSGSEFSISHLWFNRIVFQKFKQGHNICFYPWYTFFYYPLSFTDV